MLAIGLRPGLDAAEIAAGLLDDGLIVNAPVPQTLRLLPPLVITEAEVETALARLASRLSQADL